MIYREIKADVFLSNFIKCFWEFQNKQEDTEHTILPDGYFDLILEIENESLTDLFLTGVWTKPQNVFIKKGVKLLGIRCKLISAEFLFKQEIKTILDKSSSLPITFWEINEMPFNEFDKFSNILSKNIHQKLESINKIDARKFNLFDIIYQQKGCLEVGELSKLIYWSSRQINRYFNKQFGFSLKTFSNILRCFAAYKDIANGKTSPPLDFYDQAHFIKEIKRHTGNTPKQLYNNINDRFLQLKTIDVK
ncbi:MAG: AraC family transcriptional regulator [bacterium]